MMISNRVRAAGATLAIGLVGAVFYLGSAGQGFTPGVTMPMGCNSGESPQWDGAAWQCRPALNAIYSKPWQSGRYYAIPQLETGSTSSTLGNGTMRAIPFWVPNRVTISHLAAEITVAGDVGSVLRLGIYADDGTGRPSTLLLDAGTIDAHSATVQEITGLSLTLNPGMYWIATVVQNVTVTQPTVRINGTGVGAYFPVDFGTTLPAAGASLIGFDNTGVTGALPATFTIAASVGNAARVIAFIQ